MNQETFTILLSKLYNTRLELTNKLNELTTLQANAPNVSNDSKLNFSEFNEFKEYKDKIEELNKSIERLYSTEDVQARAIRDYVPEELWGKKIAASWVGRGQFYTLVQSDTVEVHQFNNYHTI